jgi:hypothetical protein
MSAATQLMVKYRGGVSGLAAKARVGHPFRLEVGNALTLLEGVTESSLLKTTTRWAQVWSTPLAGIRAVHLDPLGGTRPHAGAVVAFGVAGLAARRPTGVTITIETASASVIVETKESLAQVRSAFSCVPALKPKLSIDGRPCEPAVPAALGASSAPAVSDQLTQLAGLHAAGALDDAEFKAAKRKLLGG